MSYIELTDELEEAATTLEAKSPARTDPPDMAPQRALRAPEAAAFTDAVRRYLNEIVASRCSRQRTRCGSPKPLSVAMSERDSN